MLYLVEMDVAIPHGIDPQALAKIKQDEKEMGVRLQKEGRWRHLWRVAGRYANVSVFDVENHDELHDLLSQLPFFPFLTIRVTPLVKHPSAISRKGTDS
ncbi:MAG: muconolactone Delta-isomerase [Thermoplasmata archaeon]